jgi:ABC-type multidrug transport system fused ATPase/permease subunit
MHVLHVQAANQIAVVEDGRVTELGTHDELQKQGGLYQELVSSQTLSFADL